MNMKEQIEKRIAELKEEMERVTREAANQAAIPYRAAIGELLNILKMIEEENTA